MSDLTTCQVITGRGRSAIAVIRLSGPAAGKILSICFQAATSRPFRPGQIRYGQWTDGSQEDDFVGESVVLAPIEDQSFELHCHGGMAAVTRVIDAMKRHGAEESPPGDASAADWLIADAEAVLLECTAKQPAAIAMDQVRGAMADWRDRAVVRLSDGSSGTEAISRSALRLLESAAVGKRLATPFDVVLAGPPNVGKSSLINALVGYERSIATAMVGTTRDVLDADTVLAGWPIRLRDTAGLHATGQEIEREGIKRAEQAIRHADLVILVSQPGDQSNSMIDRLVAPSMQEKPVIEVLNKTDLKKADLDSSGTSASIRTVAITGEGIDALSRAMIEVLTETLPESGEPVPISERQIEWLRRVAACRQVDEQLACLQNR